MQISTLCPTSLQANAKKYNILNVVLYFKDIPNQSINFNIFYKEPFVDGNKCSWYGKDGNRGPSYPCNQEGEIVAIRRWDKSYLSVCNITAIGG